MTALKRSLLQRLYDSSRVSAEASRRHGGDISEMFDAMSGIFTEAAQEIERLGEQAANRADDAERCRSSKNRNQGELEDPIALANRVLDRSSGDPDDDLAILARQLIRRQEWAETWHRALETVATVLEVPSAGDPPMLLRDISEAIQKLRSPPETEARHTTIDFRDACDEASEPTGVDWIAVKDRAPDHSEPVVYARQHSRDYGRWSVGIAYWTQSQRWNPEQESTEAPDGFTHWKPLGRRPALKSGEKP